MCCKGFAKRVLPFFVTFAVGLFIASFFVSIAAPNFQLPSRGRRHREMDRQKDLELQQLREENLRLKSQRSDWENPDYQNLKYMPPVPPAPPAPPTLKNVPREVR